MESLYVLRDKVMLMRGMLEDKAYGILTQYMRETVENVELLEKYKGLVTKGSVKEIVKEMRELGNDCRVIIKRELEKTKGGIVRELCVENRKELEEWWGRLNEKFKNISGTQEEELVEIRERTTEECNVKIGQSSFLEILLHLKIVELKEEQVVRYTAPVLWGNYFSIEEIKIEEGNSKGIGAILMIDYIGKEIRYVKGKR